MLINENNIIHDKTMNHTFGIHLPLDVENCDAQKLVDNHLIYNLLNNLPAQFSMNKMTLPYVVEWKDKFAGIPGISGFVMIAESHISVHTFPEQRYVFFDIFSCNHFDVKPIINFIKKQFGSNKATSNVIERGKNFERNIAYPPEIIA